MIWSVYFTRDFSSTLPRAHWASPMQKLLGQKPSMSMSTLLMAGTQYRSRG